MVRLDLLLKLGAELRLGQVARAWRSDIDLDAETFLVRSFGKKRGEVVKLTGGQTLAVCVALSGYLAELEQSGMDYRLFPSGHTPWRAVRQPPRNRATPPRQANRSPAHP